VTGRPAPPDEGSATVLVLAATTVIVLLTGALVGVGMAITTRHRAALAADVAALAAAASVAEGEAAACSGATAAAERDGAVVVFCSVAGAVASVRTRVKAPAWILWAGAAEGRARAGPDADAEEPGGVAPES